MSQAYRGEADRNSTISGCQPRGRRHWHSPGDGSLQQVGPNQGQILDQHLRMKRSQRLKLKPVKVESCPTYGGNSSCSLHRSDILWPPARGCGLYGGFPGRAGQLAPKSAASEGHVQVHSYGLMLRIEGKPSCRKASISARCCHCQYVAKNNLS